MRALLPGGLVLSRLVATRGRAVPATTTAPPVGVPAPAPTPSTVAGGPSAYVLQRLAAWRLLHDLPFGYLVPDAAMLPPESIRFFHVDPGWLDALTDAALALGTDATTWQTRGPLVAPLLRGPVLESMPWVRDVRRGRLVVDTGPAWPPVGWLPPGPVTPPPVTGFLLRSALVSGWPGTQVRAWTTAGVPVGADPDAYAADHPDTVVPLLRVERLSPGVLLALFGGVPRLVWLEEPHHGVQLGVDVAPRGGPLDGFPAEVDPGLPAGGAQASRTLAPAAYTVAVRDETGTPTGETVRVPLRAGALPGTLDVAALADALDAVRPLDAPRGGAAMGLALLQPPARQRFAGGAG